MNKKNQSFLEFSEDIFYNFSQRKPGSIKLRFSKTVTFPVIIIQPHLEIIIPLPQKQGQSYLFEGMIFENEPNERKNMLCLFLATIYHLASHASVSQYSNYYNWLENKTPDISLKIIDFIEDFSVAKYIIQREPELSKNIQHIDSMFLQNSVKHDRDSKIRSLVHGADDQKKISSMSTNTLKDQDKIVFAEWLYKNREVIQEKRIPYHERHNTSQIFHLAEKSPDFKPFGIFQENIDKLDKLWINDELYKSKLLQRYEKHLKGLNFDKIIIPTGDFNKFTHIKEENISLMRRIKEQINQVENSQEETKVEQIGYLNMQLAIQALSSEGQATDVFEQDENKRVEEAWIILIDKSGSMGLRFEQIKEFTTCIAETANELAGKPDAWAIFSFDTSFQILKDFKEKYSQEIQARVGAIENSGLTLLPDAIELSRRILAEDPRERKFIFLITDGYSSGHGEISQDLSKIIKKLQITGVTLIPIGVSKTLSKQFKNTVRGSDLRQLVAKFITAYKTVSVSDM